jgi:bla regulator protein blaR1
MISEHLSQTWTDLAPALKDHLWQSTIFLLAASLLAAALRKNHARTRYWLWLAASIKFLIPFSLLASIHLHPYAPHPRITPQAGLYSTIEQVGTPFAQQAASGVSLSRPHSTHFFPMLLIVLWLTGFVVVLALWCISWRRVSAAMHQAKSLQEGRVWDTLRRLEARLGRDTGLRLLSSPISLEPGIFGIFRLVLIWPSGISEHLSDAHLEAILMHEICHVRRRDNLAAAIHMLTEAIFWFHPLVWWLGARMVAERERACDEEVLHLSSQPRIYAESILKVCEFCIESPLPCVSGVTGADLRIRIANILDGSTALSLNLSRKILLTTAGLTAIAIPIVFAQANANAPFKPSIGFDVVSIKLNTSGSRDIRIRSPPDSNSMTTTSIPLQMLIQTAYDLPIDDMVSGIPDWVRSSRYDITAKVAESDLPTFLKYGSEQRNPMFQAILESRFKLKFHYVDKVLPAYDLVLAKGSSTSKMKEDQPGTPAARKFAYGPGKIQFEGQPMVRFVRILSQQLGRPIVDKTGLMGNYTFDLKWTPDQGAPDVDSGVDTSGSAPSIFTAVQEQLGLKLEPTKAPVPTLVIDSIQRPTEN